jgi:cobalt/nickel transport system permease protein
MHMADALISPAVGGTLWAATAGMLFYCSRTLRQGMDDAKVPLMGVLGAFIFAAQMLNFSIPGTGSSGHLGGGLILAMLLGPHAAFLTIASVLTVQAFFFADGGILALGCNILNLGLFPCFVAYPLIFRRIAGREPGRFRLAAASVLAAVLGLLLGAFGVVVETLASGISDLPFSTFVLLMLPIHLAIGLVEGAATAAVALFVRRARPEILAPAVPAAPAAASRSLRPVLVGFLLAAFAAGGVFSWFASADPDGLEWSVRGVTGKEEVERPRTAAHEALASLQERTAVLPDYDLPKDKAEAWPNVNAGTSLAGVVGGAVTLGLTVLVGLMLRRRRAAS